MTTTIIHLITEAVRDKFIELKQPAPNTPLTIHTVANRPENPTRVSLDDMPYVFLGFGSTRPGGAGGVVGEELDVFSVFAYIVVRTERDAEAQTRLGLTEQELMAWQCGAQETLDDCYVRLVSEGNVALNADRDTAYDQIREHQTKDLLTVSADIENMMREMAAELNTFDLSTQLDYQSVGQPETYGGCEIGDFSTVEGKFTNREFLQVRFDFRVSYFT